MTDAYLEAAAAAVCPNPNARLVLLEIALALSRWGECFFSVGELAERTGLSERSVQRALAALVESGLLAREERRRRDGSRTSDSLRMIAPRIVRPARKSRTGASDSQGAPAPSCQGGVTGLQGPTSFEGSPTLTGTSPVSFGEEIQERGVSREVDFSAERRDGLRLLEPGDAADLQRTLAEQFAPAADRAAAWTEGVAAALTEIAAAPAFASDAPELSNIGPILGLLREGQGPPCDLQLDVLPTIRAVAAASPPGRIRSWKFFARPILRARDARLTGAPAVVPVVQDPAHERDHALRPAAAAVGRRSRTDAFLAGAALALAARRGVQS